MRVCRSILVLVLSFIVMIAIARLQGDKNPSPFATLFTDPSGTLCRPPCIFGIRPGETPFDDGIKILKSHPFLGVSQSYKDKLSYTGLSIGFSGSWIGQNRLSGNILWITVNRNKDSTVSQIILHVENEDISRLSKADRPLFSLADAILILGTPTLRLDTNGILDRNFYFHNNSVRINVVPTEGQDYKDKTYKPRLTDRVIEVEVISSYEDSSQLKWCGFASRLCK